MSAWLLTTGGRMRVVVTGGAGFIGSHIAEHFASTGCEVVVVDNHLRGRLLGKENPWQWYNRDYLSSRYSNVRFIEADVRDAEKMRECVRGSDLIVHAAAQVAVTSSLNDPLTDFMINAYGTLSLLEAARGEDAALIFLSTNKVYGDGVNKIPKKDLGTRYWYDDPAYVEGIPESFPVDGCVHTPYGCSKLAADLYVQDYGRLYGLRAVVFRMSCIYGERQFGAEDQGWLAHFALKALRRQPITIYGDGKQVRDVLYVKDLVEAVSLAYKNSSKIWGEVFNIGGGPGNSVSLLEAITYLEELAGWRIKYSFADWRPADQVVYVSDIRKASRDLGWQPTTSWMHGVRRMYDWLRSVVG
jgi:CDP-paratose 2-epimerase